MSGFDTAIFDTAMFDSAMFDTAMFDSAAFDRAAFDTAAFAATLPWAAGAVLLVAGGAFAASLAVHRHNVVDVAWGSFFGAVAVVTFLRSAGHGDPARRWLLLVLPVVWGLRLAVHIARRSRGKGEDPRYERLLSKAPGNRSVYALRTVYGLQALLALLISAPLLVGAFSRAPAGPLAWVGVVVWAVGLAFEGIGDRQLEQFRASPDSRGQIMDRGLWRYTRHPNYFGDACVWWGIFLVAASGWPGVLTVPAPVVMTLLLTKGSGARILDQHMSSRPGWADYAARTSGFFPLPPKSGRRVTEG